MNALQFGLNVSTSAAPGADPVADSRRAEELGFDFVSASDHPCGPNPTFETWTMLSWIAAATSRIRVATRVLGVPYRPPAMVAKMAESLDRLSGGRLILGLGGGYSDDEFRAFGLRVPSSPRDKIDGLEEAILVTRGLWSQQRFSYEGRIHRTEEADLEPKPEHHIPIWLGTFGNRALALTGRLADGWIPSLGFAPPDQIAQMRDRVLSAAEAAGRDPGQVTCALNISIQVGGAPDPDPDVVSGAADEVVERLLTFCKLGFTAMNFMTVGPDPVGQAERLAREIVPMVRAA
ncbi:LLM class flavin-dependent oxidoreductase [Acrocarpospora macrocephala]|uniref:N5,N10-methylene tetrahydromethanopterin reductase n=1 Tax=Acrocarpospora macrocephala TaxID=150177 RepID=A0A5M3WWQ8_9ACTN|nr:LLM class flavin-dependent oxidoreductase [Acrocarpospora macrocephala]GES12826.1 N5,N10-methylene tetrahydromethanopterin reductase [Acrocarpospora macrocephala]